MKHIQHLFFRQHNELNPCDYVFDILIFVFKTFYNCHRLQPEEPWFYKILWEVKFKFNNLDERGDNYYHVYEWELQIKATMGWGAIVGVYSWARGVTVTIVSLCLHKVSVHFLSRVYTWGGAEEWGTTIRQNITTPVRWRKRHLFITTLRIRRHQMNIFSLNKVQGLEWFWEGLISNG